MKNKKKAITKITVFLCNLITGEGSTCFAAYTAINAHRINATVAIHLAKIICCLI
jgi:hypothetical protein